MKSFRHLWQIRLQTAKPGVQSQHRHRFKSPFVQLLENDGSPKTHIFQKDNGDLMRKMGIDEDKHLQEILRHHSPRVPQRNHLGKDKYQQRHQNIFFHQYITIKIMAAVTTENMTNMCGPKLELPSTHHYFQHNNQRCQYHLGCQEVLCNLLQD